MRVKLLTDWIPPWNLSKTLKKGLELGLSAELGRELVEGGIAVQLPYDGRVQVESEKEEPQIIETEPPEKPKKRGNPRKIKNLKL